MRGWLPIIAGLIIGAGLVSLAMLNDTATGRPIGMPETPAEARGEDRTPSADTPATVPQEQIPFDQDLQPPAGSIYAEIQAIVDRATVDAAGTIAAAASLPQHEQRRLALLRLAPVLAETDPRGALVAAGTINPPALETEFAEALFNAWAEADAAGLLQYLETGTLTRKRPPRSAFNTLAAHDPQRLLEMSQTLRRDVRERAAAAALDGLIDQDPAAALAGLDAIPPGASRSNLVGTAIAALSQADPETAWDWVVESGAERALRFTVIRAMHAVNPDRAWEYFQSEWNTIPTGARQTNGMNALNYVNAVVNSENPDDIVAGLDRLVSLDDPIIRQNLTTNLQLWSNNNPEDALKWTLDNLDNINAEGILPSLSAGLARSDPDLARDTLLRLDARLQSAWSAGVARELAQTSLEAAEAWAFEAPLGPARDGGLTEVLYAQSEGGTIDRQLFELFDSDDLRSNAANIVVTRLACDGNNELAHEVATAYINNDRTLQLARQLIDDDGGEFAPSQRITCGFRR